MNGSQGFSKVAGLLFIILLSQIPALPAFALLMDLREKYSPLILSETAPFVFSPASLTPADYEVRWVGKPLNGVNFRIGEKSIEWVRGDLVFVLPRGRLILDAEGVEAGSLRNQGFVQSLVVKDGKGY